jgi:hypothetical protein
MEEDDSLTRDMLLQYARTAIRDGKIPGKPSTRVFGGPGKGERCSICDTPITAMGLDLEFEPEGITCQAHLDCFSAWQTECENGEATTAFARTAS